MVEKAGKVVGKFVLRAKYLLDVCTGCVRIKREGFCWKQKENVDTFKLDLSSLGKINWYWNSGVLGRCAWEK